MAQKEEANEGESSKMNQTGRKKQRKTSITEVGVVPNSGTRRHSMSHD